MGLFGKRDRNGTAAVSIPPQAALTGDVGGIPSGPASQVPAYYPLTYTSALEQAGKPVTDNNIDALARFTAWNIAINAWNIAINAEGWFHALGDGRAKGQFHERFQGSSVPEPVGHLADQMIDFLWNWTPKCHDALHDFTNTLVPFLANHIRHMSDTLPENLVL
jgi:hypothetical protein